MFRTYYSGSYPVVLIVVLILESPLTPYQPDLDKASHLNLKMTPLNKINNGNVIIEIRVLQNLVASVWIAPLRTTLKQIIEFVSWHFRSYSKKTK